jgi:invasion protein IalB
MIRSVVLLSGFVASAAWAEDAAPTERVLNGQTFGAWTVSCEAIAAGETVCILNQQLYRDTDQAFLAQLLAVWSDDLSTRFLLARVPVGVYLPYGIAVRPEGGDAAATALPLVWQSCNPQVCEALAELDAARIAALTAPGTIVVASYRPSLAAEPLAFRFSMEGMVEGMDALPPGG